MRATPSYTKRRIRIDAQLRTNQLVPHHRQQGWVGCVPAAPGNTHAGVYNQLIVMAGTPTASTRSPDLANTMACQTCGPYWQRCHGSDMHVGTLRTHTQTPSRTHLPTTANTRSRPGAKHASLSIWPATAPSSQPHIR